MNQTVNAVLNFNKRAEVSEVAHPAFDGRAHGILLMQRIPRISSELPHAQRNAAFLRMHVQHHAVHMVANIHQLRGMLHAFGPRHFADVHQSLDALLQFDKRAVVSHADDASANVCADGITMFGVKPWIWRQLLEA